MATRTALFLGILLSACALPPRVAESPPRTPAYSFELDGLPLHPRIFSMEGDPSEPRPGDLVEVEGRLLILDGPGPHRWRRSPDPAAPLLRLLEDGGEAMAFLELGEGLPAPGRPMEGVRGIRILTWTPDAAAIVGSLDPERYCLEIQRIGPDNPPDLPSALRYLAINTERLLDGFPDWAGTMRGLRYLGVRVGELSGDFDATKIDALRDLRVLRLERVGLDHAERLGQLIELRDLALLRCDEPGKPFRESAIQVGFLTFLPRLRRLDVTDSAVRDLEAAGAHPALESLTASGGLIEKLPTRPLHALRTLTMPEGRALASSAIDAFRAAHPRCRVITDWGQILRNATAGADRIRFRSGGTCHRAPGKEKTFSDESGAQAVRAFLDAVQLTPMPSNGRCMCCGGPTVEIYAGASLLAELGMQHAYGFRWSAAWPGDATLTLESNEAVCRWMAARGDEEPLREFEKDARRRRSANSRMKIVKDLLPASFRERMTTVDSREAALAAFDETIPGDLERGTLALRIYGAGEGSWIRPFWLEFMARDALEALSSSALGQALAQASIDPGVADGAARWIFHAGKPEDLPIDARDGILRIAAERALAHPRAFNRRRTMEVLGGQPGETATGLLRRVLAASIPIRGLPSDLVEEPFQGFVPPETGDVWAAFSDRAYAALLLARRDDRASLPAIMEFEGEASAEDREALRTARELLGPK